MVPSVTMVNLAKDRNSELNDRLNELVSLYRSRHATYLKRMALVPIADDPILDKDTKQFAITAMNSVKKYSDKLDLYLEAFKKVEIDDEFRDILYNVADQYSNLLNDYMEVKSTVLNVYADAINMVNSEEDTVLSLVRLRDDVKRYLNHAVGFIKIVCLSVRNEMKAMKIRKETSING